MKMVLCSLPTNKVLFGEAPPRGLTPYPFIHHFSQKRYRYPLQITFFDKWYLFHIPSFELCIHLNSCKCTVFKIWINHKTRTFFPLLHRHKMHLSALLGFYTNWKDIFSYPFIYIINWWNPHPFIYLKPGKGTPLGQSLPQLFCYFCILHPWCITIPKDAK